MTLASYGNQINEVLTDLQSYMTTQLSGDVGVYIAFPEREVKESDYPMVVINELGMGNLEFVGERLSSGEGEWHNMNLQCNILTKRGKTVDDIGNQTLLRKLQIVLEEIFRGIDNDINAVFTSVPAVRLITGEFIELSWLEPEGLFRKACTITIIFEHIR